MGRLKDLVGCVFGKLTVLKLCEEKDKWGRSQWHCQCSCPNNTKLIVRHTNLISGNNISCGCAKVACQVKDLVGQKFNFLTVIKFAYTYNRHAYWLCKCSNCKEENEVLVTTHRLRNSNTKSCGCLNDQKRRERCKENSWNWNPDREQIELNKKMKQVFGGLLHRVLNLTNQDKDKRSYEMLGYTQTELMEYLNIKTKKDLKNKHIDHIFPVVAFIRIGITDPKIINALDNLQILSINENLSKGDKYNEVDFLKYINLKMEIK